MKSTLAAFRRRHAGRRSSSLNDASDEEDEEKRESRKGHQKSLRKNSEPSHGRLNNCLSFLCLVASEAFCQLLRHEVLCWLTAWMQDWPDSSGTQSIVDLSLSRRSASIDDSKSGHEPFACTKSPVGPGKDVSATRGLRIFVSGESAQSQKCSTCFHKPSPDGNFIQSTAPRSCSQPLNIQ